MKRIKLLVSVRSVEEAVAVAKVGVDCIDIKEPIAGPLGRASDEVIRSIEFASRVMRTFDVTAAAGEWLSDADFAPDFYKGCASGTGAIHSSKWGFAGCRDHPWQPELRARLVDERNQGSDYVPVAYADWDAAEAPEPAEFLEITMSGWKMSSAERQVRDGFRSPRLLGTDDPSPFRLIGLDTYQKDGESLFCKLSVDFIRAFVERAHAMGVEVALAGSIQWMEIPALNSLRPDWIAVRGLVCEDGDRKKPIDPARVQRLKDMLN